MATIIKDELYFMETIIFQVENCLFKVPRYHFENNSEIFASTFLLPTGDNKPEGSSEAAPFKLEGISARDFRNFLAALYPLSHSPELSEDQWVSILKLSTMWMFLEHRQTAIEQLLSKFPITLQTVLLGRAYGSVRLFTEGCSALIWRSTSLSDDEASELGYETAFRLCILREKSKGRGSTTAEIAQTFEKEISVIVEEEAQYGTQLRQPPSQPEQPVQPSKKRRRQVSDVFEDGVRPPKVPSTSRNPYKVLPTSRNPYSLGVTSSRT